MAQTLTLRRDPWGDVLRCEGCGIQFACEPTVYGEKGDPWCKACLRALDSIPIGCAVMGRELHGDRRSSVLIEDD